MLNRARLLPLFVLALVLSPVASALAADDAEVPLKLIPMPQKVKLGVGTLVLGEGGRVVAADRKLAPLAQVLSDEILTVTGIRLKAARGQGAKGDIVLNLDPDQAGESYSLSVSDRAAVAGGNYFAVASGTVTLLQALRCQDGKLSLPCMTIHDKPAYPYRGAMIDLARKYHSPDGIKQVIQLCRLYKIRYLQVHISDDHLFMFPSTAFPQAGRSNQEFARFEPKSKPKIKPYTLEELRDLERFSQARGVHIVPEMDMPGHSGRLIADCRQTFGFAGNGSTVHIASRKTFKALTTLVNEVMDVFQGTPYVHLGADEVGLGGLEKTPEFKAARELDPAIKSAHDMYCKFIRDMHGVIARRGKRMIAWEEAYNPRGPFPLPKDVLLMVWCQGRSPADIIKNGYDIINATWTPLYIVRDNCKSLPFLFKWDLLKFGREGSESYRQLPANEKVVGAQLCSWENSECIEIQFMRDRLALVGQRAWNPKAGGDLAAFRTRLAHTDAILGKLVHPVRIQVRDRFVRGNTFAEPITVTLVPSRKDLTTKYTLDNSMPGEHWKTYTAPLTLKKTAHVRAGLFDRQGRRQGYLSGSWFQGKVALKPNLATHKPVTVGPGSDRTDNWGAKNAVDGRVDDVWAHWASAGPAPQWLQVDLGKVHPVKYINVITYYDGSRYYQMTVEVSVDGKTWKKVIDFSDNKIPATAAGHFAKCDKTDARYVRVNILKNSANPFVHIVELIVQ